MMKATFTFDEDTSRRLTDTSNRLGRPKSEIVRDAINEYHAKLDRLTDPVARARGREVDLAIAGTAISRGASLWTLNPRDFADLPGIRL